MIRCDQSLSTIGFYKIQNINYTCNLRILPKIVLIFALEYILNPKHFVSLHEDIELHNSYFEIFRSKKPLITFLSEELFKFMLIHS